MRRAVIAGAATCGILVAQATTTLTGSAIVSGANTSNSPSGCFTLVSSLGSAAIDKASGGNFKLQGGFLAGRNGNDAIFRGNFEVCA